jgi:excisionase family DNA binding protein
LFPIFLLFSLCHDFRFGTGSEGRDTKDYLRKLHAIREETPSKMDRQKEVMTLREASQYLGISPDTLYKYVGERSIPAFKLGNRWRFKKDLLDRWIERKVERTVLAGDKKPKSVVKSNVRGSVKENI